MPCIHHSDLTNSTFPYISPYFLGRQKTLYITLKSPFPSFFPFSLPIVTTILKLECVIPCLVLYFYYMYVSHCLNLHFLTTNEFEHFFRYLLTIKGLLLFVSLVFSFFLHLGCLSFVSLPHSLDTNSLLVICIANISSLSIACLCHGLWCLKDI